jgi:hypothetical protein
VLQQPSFLSWQQNFFIVVLVSVTQPENMTTDEKPNNVACEKLDADFVEDVAERGAAKTQSSMADLTVDPSRRAAIEKRLKLKLDARNSVFLLIYIMNYL